MMANAGIDEKLDQLISYMKEGFEKIDERFEKMDKRFDDNEGSIADLKFILEDTRDRVLNVEMRIKNEISTNIQLIAEGHLDTLRQIKEMIPSSGEVEMMKIRLNVLESKVGELQRKIS